MPFSPQISLFLDNLEEGGVQRAIVNLAQGFLNLGLKVDIVLQRAEGPFIKQVPDGVRIVDLGNPRLRASVAALANYLHQEQPKALLASLHYSTEVAILAKHWSKSSTRVVVCEQGSLAPLKKAHVPINKPLAFLGLTPGRPTSLVKYFYSWADGIVAVSQGAAEDLAEVANLPLKDIQVIYNPVITPDFTEKAREPIEHPWFTNKDIPVIVSAGRLVDQKDYPTLIRAFAQIVKVHPSRLVILGSGSDRSRLETLICQLDLKEHVVLLGHVQNPYKYMASADVFVLSSIWEGLGNVLIEAMALGTPVVATNCKSGPSEILADGKYGYLTPVGDSAALAEAISHVLSGNSKPIDPVWLDQFRLETVTQKYLNVLGITSPIPTALAGRRTE
ncbi:glycosyltransferase [Leptothermofonsia sichuanensis E412]|uniref:glycosyltransferase n=1 Tax=Leptothermofonsia sichuanensis TaxID=2917832 RepID=UPI001CA740AD|nr:glycosyltransferase [Leptothermofonsia sichuanensis]QZZ23414.1 glycosyltransferase [Leptothermofonsia sichuanensis E412]